MQVEFLKEDSRSRPIITRMIAQYLGKETFNRITLNQVSKYYGFYSVEGMMNPTPRFLDCIGWDHQSDCKERIALWLDWMSAQIRSIKI